MLYKKELEKSVHFMIGRDLYMKSVAQTVIEADRFYTIAAHTGNVIQAVEGSKDGGTTTSLSRSGVLSERAMACTASATVPPASCWI